MVTAHTDYEWSTEIIGFPDTGPGLMGAKHRLRRAAKHHADLVELVEEFENTNFDSVKIRMDLETDPADLQEGLEVDWSDTIAPPMATIAIIVGELIYNLRTALDYLIYTLAWHDSGAEVQRTQFPIVDDDQTFERKRSVWLKGVSSSHVEKIRRYQPFAGCEWTRVLRELSNPDKHKKLTLVTPRWVAYFDTDKHNWERVPDDATRVEQIVPRMEADILLDEQHPVLETLGDLLVSTWSVIDDFGYLFPDEPRLSVRAASE